MAASESAPLLKPIPNRKRKRDEVQGICILCNEECDEDKSNLSAEAWERMKDKAKDWKDLPKFGNVYDTINWEAGPNGVFFHKRCRTALASQKGLQQAVRKKRKSTETTDRRHKECIPKNSNNLPEDLHEAVVFSTKNICAYGA